MLYNKGVVKYLSSLINTKKQEGLKGRNHSQIVVLILRKLNYILLIQSRYLPSKLRNINIDPRTAAQNRASRCYPVLPALRKYCYVPTVSYTTIQISSAQDVMS